MLPVIGFAGRRRISRIVVRPDFQGVGVGRAVLNAVAAMYPRISITTGHPAMIAALRNDAKLEMHGGQEDGVCRAHRGRAEKTVQRRADPDHVPRPDGVQF